MSNLPEATLQRVRAAILGILATVLVGPVILRMWAPAWFVLTFALCYLAGAATFIAVRLRGDNPKAEFAWTAAAAVLYASVPASTLFFEPAPESIWAAGALVSFHLANEIATREFNQYGDWRIAPLFTLTALVIGAFVHLGLGMAFGCALAGWMIVTNEHSIRVETEEMRHERAHDALTGLLNRRGLLDELETLPPGGRMTVVVIDADRFKVVNDSYGYTAGDTFLQAVAGALTERFGPEWSIARHGGDEFVAFAQGEPPLPPGLTDPVTCQIPYRDEQLHVDVDLSAGVASAADVTSEDLMSRAGFALRASKRTGGGVSQFDHDFEQRFARALEVGNVGALPEAEALFAMAQPITDGDDIVGWEMLARWQGGDGAIMAPDRFLPLLAENGLMPQLNDRMLEEGVRFAARFNSRASAPFVSVNVTASHLANPNLVARVADLLERHRVLPRRLMIEITESEVLLSAWQQTARGLVDLGVMLAIDDFGSGYSSIERMNQLPVTHLKFDRSFATSISGPFGDVIVGVVSFARSTGLSVIAEGIETLDEFESMRSIGVRLFQGHRFGRPAMLDDAERLLIERAVGPDIARVQTFQRS